MDLTYAWRGTFGNAEVNELHAEAFDTRVFDESEWNWERLTAAHSLGWLTARLDGVLVGFVNVLWDGFVHAWLQDMMVASSVQRRGVGQSMVSAARAAAQTAQCEWLHVDFDSDLQPFYIEACGFTPSSAGVMSLT